MFADEHGMRSLGEINLNAAIISKEHNEAPESFQKVISGKLMCRISRS